MRDASQQAAVVCPQLVGETVVGKPLQGVRYVLNTQTWPRWHTAGEEDCLYLNVYSPLDPASAPAPTQPLPVMVWIYGGGYSVGSATWADYGPQKFLDTDQVPSSPL